MPIEGTTIAIAIAVASGVIVGGVYGLRALGLGTLARIALGILMLGCAAAFWLISDGALVEQPIQFGLWAGLLGLGINQVGTPLRQAIGGAA